MRVLHLVPSVGPLSGGMGTVALATVREQRRLQLNSTVWCVDPSEVAAAAGAAEAIVPWPVIGPRRFARSPAAERKARTSQVDVVHQHGLWTAQSRVTAVFRRRAVPTVVAPHGTLEPGAFRHSAWKKRIALAWFESRNLRQASCLHATSDTELRTFRNFGLRAPIAVVPNAVTPEWLASRADPLAFRSRHRLLAEKRVVLFLSRLHPKKGLPLLLQALSMHRENLRECQIVIAGTDADGHRREVEAMAKRLGLSDMIQFVGPIFGEEKQAAFAAADLFVLPSHSENFGLVIAEALACGVPVVTTRGTPWMELETHDCGWWVPIDSASLGGALVDAAGRSGSELQAMGARGRALIEARYLWPRVVERTISLYRWLRGEASRPSFVVLD